MRWLALLDIWILLSPGWLLIFDVAATRDITYTRNAKSGINLRRCYELVGQVSLSSCYRHTGHEPGVTMNLSCGAFGHLVLGFPSREVLTKCIPGSVQFE